MKVCIPDIYLLKSANLSDVENPQEAIENLGGSALLARNYGATGDGSTDDRTAIQAALAAIESGESDVLDFGSGTYRVAGYTSAGAQPLFNLSAYMLKLGTADMADRDISIIGDGATIYFDQGDDQMEVASLWILAKFRSLTIKGVRFERDGDIPRESAPDAEPNFNDLVAITCYDDRVIESVRIERCGFVNGHKPIGVYGLGWDTRDKLKFLRVTDNQFLQPYGSNIDNSSGDPYGGGQQLTCDSWVENAIVTGNDFDGGALDVTDENPSGNHKDGSFFGSPRNLIFTENIVRRMGVESIYHIPQYLLMELIDDAFTMPAVNANVTIALNGNRQATFEVGQEIFIKNTGVFEVVDRDGNNLEIKNLGGDYNVAPSTAVAAGQNIYSNELSPSRAIISDNTVIDSDAIAIVSAVRSVISENIVINAMAGITIYTRGNSEAFDDPAFSVIEGNNITLGDGDGATYAYGINTSGTSFGAPVIGASNVTAKGNTITAPSNIRVYGIHARGDDWMVEGNQIFAATTTPQGEAALTRGQGIVLYGERCVARGNKTGGLDVGAGPEAGYAQEVSIVHHEDSTSVLSVASSAYVNYVPRKAVKFSAHNNGVAFPVTDYDTAYTDVIFSTADQNVESCYDPVTGIYTPKYAGMYEFGMIAIWSDSVAAANNGEIWLEYVGATRAAHLFRCGDPAGVNTAWSGSVRLPLAKNQQVKLRITQNTDGTKNLNGAENMSRIWGGLIS